MTRIIHLDSAGRERARLTKCLVLAARELARKTEPDAESRDLAAFIVLALEGVAATIEPAAAAWEKRGYWVKADKFRREWAWAGNLARNLRAALLREDWAEAAEVAAEAARRLGRITVPPGHRLGRPWVGAWQALKGGK